MATNTFFFFLITYFLSLFLLCSFETCFAKSHGTQNSHTVQLSSLLPSSTCNPSSKVPTHKASLKVVHKHSPCSHLQQEHENTTDLAHQILRQDQARVDSIRARLTHSARDSRYEQAAVTTLPAKPGRALGFANYFVTVGLGTPKKDVSLVFDTGSDLTWTQCQPCDGHCFPQKEAIFDPSASSSYTNQLCSSPTCSNLDFTSRCPPDATSTCIYHVGYGDNSITEGYLASETLTLTTSDVIDKFLFGCGQNNGGLFVGIAGLLGLGRGSVSIVQQASQNYNKLFSYCLPSSSSTPGYLALGAAGNQAPPQYTPMLNLNGDKTFYGIQISGISVHGSQLTEAEAALVSAKTIIDSGTVITRLPPAAYAALKAEFKKYMAKYPPMGPSPSGILDTCYDLSGAATNGTVEIPKVSLSFGGGATVDLMPSNILFGTSASHLCLAFAAGNDVAILGNVQQTGFDVVYDVAGARIGFSPGGC